MSDASGSTTWDYSAFDTTGRITKTSVINGSTFEVTQTHANKGTE